MLNVPVFSDDVTQWLRRGERGISSETIVARLMGVPFAQRESHPHDPDDFRRCLLLLEACPSLAPRFPEMRGVNPIWKHLVDAWDEIETTFRRELASGRGHKTYDLMRAAIAKGEAEMPPGGRGWSTTIGPKERR